VIVGNGAAYRGQIEAAQAGLQLAQRHQRLLTERGGGGWAMPMLLQLPIIIDELDQAEELINQAERAARASGSTLGRLMTVASSAWLRARRGDLIGAEVDLTTLLTLGQEMGVPMLISNIALYLIDVLLERGDAAPAGAAIEDTPIPPEFLPTWSGAMLIEARGRLRLARGARAEAVEDLREAGRTADTLGFGPVISGWRSALALGLAGEDPQEALRLASEDLSLARESGLARPIGIALRTLGIVHARSAAGTEYLRESVAVLDGGPSRLEHARSLIALGGALRRGNQSREARSILSAGLNLAVVCGAERLTDDAQQELLAAGGRRRHRQEQGVESLTASELRVAKLAATGLSNVEIAQSLFVSVKTVETHLAHVYGKFGLAGIGSRWRLAELLTEGV
jgi:ATP/maltotriose-dependent transcriptional regulator MalT